VAIAGITIVAVGLAGRLSGSAAKPSASPVIPEPGSATLSTAPPDLTALRRTWERPYGVAPGFVAHPSAWLSIGAGWLDLRTDPDGLATRWDIIDIDAETMAVSAASATLDCAPGDVGTYGWSITGSGTWLDLLPIGADDCAARQTALADSWVVGSFAVPGGELAEGTHLTELFDPFHDSRRLGQLSFTVPAGWLLVDDAPGSLTLSHVEGEAPTQTTSSITLFSEPHVPASLEPGAPCDTVLDDMPGVGNGVAQLAAAIGSKPGVDSTPWARVTVGGVQGLLSDLRVRETWAGGCTSSDGPVVVVPLLSVDRVGAGPGRLVGITPFGPARILLLDMGSGRTVAIFVGVTDPGGSGPLDERVAPLMPIVDSFVFHPPGT
jgi:hypothetical protein